MNITDDSEAAYARRRQEALENAQEIIARKYFWPKLIFGTLIIIVASLIVLILLGY